MGLLSVFGKPLPYAAAKQYFQYIRDHALVQFINLHNQHKDRTLQESQLKFGYESEYHVVNNKTYKIIANAILLKDSINNLPNIQFQVLPEYGGWMWEFIPKNAFSLNVEGILSSADHLAHSYNFASKYLNLENKAISSVASYPLLGVGKYYEEGNLEHSLNPFSQSIYTSDSCITPHPRFPALTENIKLRRGKKVEILIPAFRDENTKISHIDMDSMQFGMGCCSLQATYDATDLKESLKLTDNLHVLSPLVASLSASAPIYRGMLSDIDLRWNVISQSVDDRFGDELNPSSPKYLRKTRFSSMNHFLSTGNPKLNDRSYIIDPKIMETLVKNKIDNQLSYHISSLLLRDPLVIFDQAINLDDAKRTAHFENFQSTNWNSVRFKPPPFMDSNIGWRVEFRTPDLQLSSVENNAILIFVSLLVKVIKAYNVEFLMPISKCDENMERAHKRNSVVGQKFYYRNNVHMGTSGEIGEMSLKDILIGKNACGGLFGLIFKYVISTGVSNSQMDSIVRHFAILLGKADGRLPTGAAVIREFVANHSEYKKDSVVSEHIAVDLLSYISTYDITANKNYQKCYDDVKTYVK